uniref:Putative membrane protein C2G11.09 n=1 Tax=Anthurium amnicola TaxID=1678845 RepID=A0A1D1XSZ1_9ARAE
MILSALLTSVGINLGLCFLFFVLYSVLRKQPENARVYASRQVVEGRAQQRSGFDIERFLPSPGWMRRAWAPSEDELQSVAGLDAVVFMRIIIFSLRVFSVAGIVGVFILLPINYHGDQLHISDFADLPNESLEKFSISNVKDGSNWLWVHFSAAYLMTAVICYLLYVEYKYISSRRLAYFYASKPQPHHFTILVRGIPKSTAGHFSDSVEGFFSEYHSSTYLSHTMVRQTSKLRRLINDAENMYRRLTHLKSRRHLQQVIRHGDFRGQFRNDADSVVKYEKKLEDLEENVRIEQSDVSSTGEEVPAAFVCFRSRYGAATAIHIQQSVDPTQWVTEQAPEPYDVYWPFFSTTFMKRWISKLVVFVASVVLTVLFLLPVAFVQGLANLDKLEILFPFLKAILTITFVSQVITGYLPSLILHMFLSLVPPIMKIFSTMQGYNSHSETEKSACSKMLLFTIWNAFFAIVLSGSIASQAEVFLDPRHIPWRLAVAVPAQATFFITYVVTSGWTNASSELTRMMPLIGDFIGRHCSKNVDDEFHAPSIPYYRDIPSILFLGLLGSTYFLLAPLILPFLLVYFCLGYIIYRNQLLNVYMPKYETAGKFWPIVHNSTIFALVLMQLIAIGIFGLKKLPLASSLTVPLPILTLLFNEYCRKRFLPIFLAYSAESLIKKDREEQNDPAMPNFLDNLATAYIDPALMPIQHSVNADGRTSPFLS